jgi:hypothetical protein
MFLCFGKFKPSFPNVRYLNEGHNELKKFFTIFYSLSVIRMLYPDYNTPSLKSSFTHPFLPVSYKNRCLLFFKFPTSD